MAAVSTNTEPPPQHVFESVDVVTPEGVTFGYELAGIGARFLGALIDVCVIIEAILLIFWVLFAAGGLTVAIGPGLTVAVVSTAVFVIQFFYVFALEQIWRGRTVGKWATRTRVISVDGGPVTVLQSAIRGVSWLFEVVLLPAVALGTAMVTRRSQRLGDLGAGTLVVRNTRRAREGVQALPTAAAYDPNAVFRTWDITAVDADHVAVVRQFLERRTVLAPEARVALARTLGERLRPHVMGPDETWPDELFLEALVAAKILRE